jgi:hypothetical protein
MRASPAGQRAPDIMAPVRLILVVRLRALAKKLSPNKPSLTFFLTWAMAPREGGGLIFNRAPALLRRSVCAFRVPRGLSHSCRESRNSRAEGRPRRAWRCPPPTPGAPKAKDWTRLRAAKGRGHLRSAPTTA